MNSCGAILFFGAGSIMSSAGNTAVSGNTFVGNEAHTTVDGQKQRGGATSKSGYLSGIVMTNNLFVDNKVQSAPGVFDEPHYIKNIWFN